MEFVGKEVRVTQFRVAGSISTLSGWFEVTADTIYALFVPEESAEAAREVLRLIPDENHRCLYGCPHCGSRDVVERLLDEGFGTGWFSLPLTFGVVAFSRMIELRVRGRRYVCRACGAVYRKKP